MRVQTVTRSLLAGSLLAACLLPAQAIAQSDLETSVTAQYRVRGEVDRRFGDSTGAFVTHRARFGLAADAGDWRVYIEPQDVRGWGSEASTVQHEALVDLHQGYAQWTGSDALNIRVGRQSVAHLNQRIIGGLDWAQTGRSFDAVRGFGSIDNVDWSLFGAPLAFADGRGNRDAAVGAGLVQWTNAGRTLAALGVGDANRDARLYRWTVGPYSSGRIIGDLTYEVEGYWQTGHAQGETFDAWFYHGELGYTAADLPGRPAIRAGYSVASGETDTFTSFDTLYATNHKFYGYMDVFLALPAHTGGLGLRNGYAGVSAQADAVHTEVMVHRLTAAPGNSGVFGTEIDWVTTWTLQRGVALQAGVSTLFTGDAYDVVRPQASDAPDVPYWGYVMLNASMF